MYLRHSTVRKDGKVYTYWRLVLDHIAKLELAMVTLDFE